MAATCSDMYRIETNPPGPTALPLTVGLFYDEAALPPDRDEETLFIGKLNGCNFDMQVSMVDTVNNLVTTKQSDLSHFAVL